MYLLDADFENSRKKNLKPRVRMSREEKAVYEVLEPYGKTIGEITEELSLDLGTVIQALVQLSITGLAKDTGSGCYVRVRDCVAVISD